MVYEVVCTCGFEFLRTFVRIVRMDEFFPAVVLSYQSFDVKCLLISWDLCVYRYNKRMEKKIGGVWFSPLINRLTPRREKLFTKT